MRTNADSDAADLKIMPTAKLKEDLSKAVNAKLDECAKSTDYAPEGCPFGFDLYDEDYYRNFAWSISVYPKLSDIDLDYGTFSTRQGKAKCTYEEKNFRRFVGVSGRQHPLHRQRQLQHQGWQAQRHD